MSEENLLDALYRHGQQFLGDFGDSEPPHKRRKLYPDVKQNTTEEEQEWGGIGGDDTSGDEGSSDSEGTYASDLELDDDEFTADASSSSNAPKVVVFSDPRSQTSASDTKLSKKAFMSSKVAKLSNDPSSNQSSSKKDDADDEERSNRQNDALLYRMVHTQLLSGSLNPDLNLTPAQRRKALQGRVMELAGHSTLGKGENRVREEERNKAAKRVREGMAIKQKGRDRQRLDEAKNLGNYHPTLKKMYEPESDKKSSRRREKGMGMGVGKFSAGVLKLGRAEVDAIQGATSSRGRGGGRGRGRVRSGRGGRDKR